MIVAEQRDSLLGKTFDEYRIEKPLGVGGMAKVYRALDVKLKRYVALKVIAANLRENEQYAARFEREAQSIARLEHPNIVHIYRFGEVDGVYYMAMQYVEGADLGTLIHDYASVGEVMPIGDVVRVLQDIGAALDFAHSRDVIHRDVKPSNIMVDNTGRALLTDFGLALLADLGTRGEVLGSPHYIAPEQAVSSSNVVPQSDLYSLGISLFEMLTGEVPFTGEDLLDVAVRHIHETVPPPSQFNGAIPPSIDEVVARALEKEPYERYQTGMEMAAAFQKSVENWQENVTAASDVVRRPSLILLPQKVHAHLQTTQDAPPGPTPTKNAGTTPVAQVTTQTAQQYVSEARLTDDTPPPKSVWRGALVFSAIVFIIGLVGVLALIASRGNGGGTPTATAQSQVVVLPSATTAEVTSTHTQITVPTSQPTITPVEAAVLPTTTARYALLLSRNGDNSLYVMNMALEPFPLIPLRIGTESNMISGSAWGVETLENGACVSVWRTSGNYMSPDALCNVVGMRLLHDGAQAFWGSPFNVYYNDVLVATCETDNCLVQIPGP
jgi:serine/threonine protein kinase